MRSAHEIKDEIATLPRKTQDEIAAYLVYLRHKEDETYHSDINRRLNDQTPGAWLSLDQFEAKLDRKETR
jgi:hypothetical protein